MSDDAMIYANYTEGFKSAGFGVRSNAHPDASVGIPALVGVFEFEKEKAQSFEVGAKLQNSQCQFGQAPDNATIRGCVA